MKKTSYKNALGDINKVIMIDLTYAEYFTKRAENYEKLGEKEKAQADKDKAAELLNAN